jgi:alpha-glucuronidase
MDGKFRDNVILQSKNGPLDFQPREPYAPIFDNIKQTPQIAELQITQEYLGQSKHLTYLAPMWKEFFGFVNPDRLVGISGVANIGDDANWCGHPFSQANWYAFGRLAWNPSLTAEEIAHEWLVQTYENQDERFTKPVEMMMMTSREACVNYMMPLGLHHIFKFDHHYGPEPDGFIASYPLEWCPVYYHKADAQGIGFDRSSKGIDAVGQYPEPYRSLYDNIETCPEEYLLWFHHVPWTYKMKSGSTLWQELCMKYNMGVAMVEVYRDFWHTSAKQYMKGHEQEWQHTDSLLNVQLENAKEWRNTCLKYFQTFSKMKIYE